MSDECALTSIRQVVAPLGSAVPGPDVGCFLSFPFFFFFSRAQVEADGEGSRDAWTRWTPPASWSVASRMPSFLFATTGINLCEPPDSLHSCTSCTSYARRRPNQSGEKEASMKIRHRPSYIALGTLGTTRRPGGFLSLTIMSFR